MHDAMKGLLALAMAGAVAGCEPSDRSDFPDGAQWVDGRNIEHWPVTIRLKSATVESLLSHRHRVTVAYDRLQDIPAWNVPGDPNNVHNVNGSLWLLRAFEGQWYVGTIEYLRVGETTKIFDSSPAYRFMPQSGDRVGFMVSTTARQENGTIADGVTYQERSHVVWIQWP